MLVIPVDTVEEVVNDMRCCGETDLRSLIGRFEYHEDSFEIEPDNDWISVKDRLPDDKERYLICTENERIYIAYYQPIGDKFSNHEPFWQGSSCRFTSVTHWQPLPKRPNFKEK